MSTTASKGTRAGTFRSAFTARRIVISLVLALAGFFFVLAFTQSVDQQPETSLRPREVTDVQPQEGQPLALRQAPVAVQLAQGFTGRLRIDGKDIPDDQTDRPSSGINSSGASPGIAGLNRFSFTPGPGQEVESLTPGPHTATIIFWPLTVEEGGPGTDSYTWRFTTS